MDKFQPWVRLVRCKVENKNYSTSFHSESCIKEEIMIPDMTQDFGDETLSTVENYLRPDQISFQKLPKNKNQLAHKGQIYNLEDTNFENNRIWIGQRSIKIEEDAISNGESQWHDITHHSDWHKEMYEMCTPKYTGETAKLKVETEDKAKESVPHDKKKHKKCQKQTSTIKFCQNLSKAFENDEDKLNNVVRVCPKCTKKEKVLSARYRTKCQGCKEPMNYECLTCGDRMLSISDVFCHFRKKCGQQRTYQCNKCSFQVKNEYLLRRHVKSKHSNQPECPKCGKTFKTKMSVRLHKNTCGINVKYLKCKFCPYDTKYRCSLKVHIQKAHKNIKPQQYAGIMKSIVEEGEKIKADALNSVVRTKVNTVSSVVDYKQFIQLYCPKCDEIYENVDYEKEWDCLKCRSATLLQCVQCSKRYSKWGLIIKHLSQKCASKNCFHCAHCNYATHRKCCLQIHIGRRHTIVAPEDYKKCSKCGRQYRFHPDLVNHEKRCNREILYCNICPYKCKEERYFKIHMQKHKLQLSDAQIKTAVNIPKTMMSRAENLMVEQLMQRFCSKCEKIVKYEKHKRSVCPTCWTKLLYACDKCNKVYLYTHNLRAHVVHSHLSGELEKRLLCSSCGKSFILYESLRAHEKYCVDKKMDHRCTHCPFVTKYRRSIIQHMQKKHNDTETVDVPKRYLCVQCGNNYSCNTIWVHRRYYCGKQPSIACNHCNYKSYTKIQIDTHLRRMHKHLFTN